jgi:peptidoglycan-N-acetylglucosamine deacetylase
MQRLTLSFDNGPDPQITPLVLDVLRERQVRAHFFVLGKQVATPEGRLLVTRAFDEGHLIGNHSFSHQVPLGDDLRDDAVEREIAATEALLTPLVGPTRRFRPFGGGGVLGPHLLSPRATDYLVAHQYTCVLWTSVPHDWDEPDAWLERALAECREQRHAVLVLHDIPGACAPDLGAFIDRARQRGFAFTTDLPRASTPILDGEIIADLGAIVRSSPRSGDPS